jgi:hypothetical protein
MASCTAGSRGVVACDDVHQLVSLRRIVWAFGEDSRGANNPEQGGDEFLSFRRRHSSPFASQFRHLARHGRCLWHSYIVIKVDGTRILRSFLHHLLCCFPPFLRFLLMMHRVRRKRRDSTISTPLPVGRWLSYVGVFGMIRRIKTAQPLLLGPESIIICHFRSHRLPEGGIGIGNLA